MVLQIALGAGLIMLTLGIGAVSFALLSAGFSSAQPWLLAPPHWPKRLLLLGVDTVWALVHDGGRGRNVCGCFRALAIFPDWETSVYYALESFTTLGLGDVTPPIRWRILTAMAAANGLFNFGMLTAVLMARVRDLERGQRRSGGD